MAKKDDDDPPNYVLKSDCQHTHDKIDLALWGSDGRGGIIKDIQEIKSATSIFKSAIVPIILSVASALITAYFLKSFH